MDTARDTSTNGSGRSRTRSGAGLQRVLPGSQTGLVGYETFEIGPRRTDWTVDFLDALVPRLIRRMAGYLRERGFATRTAALDHVYEELSIGTAPLDTPARQSAAYDYVGALVFYAIRFGGEDPEQLQAWSRDVAIDRRHSTRKGHLTYARRVLATLGTHQGPENADLVDAIVILQAVTDLLDWTPTLTVTFDGDAWCDDGCNLHTEARSLGALSFLATVSDVRVICSPGCEKHLNRRFPEWVDQHFTQTADRSQMATLADAGSGEGVSEDVDMEHVWTVLRDEITQGGGHARLLGNLDDRGRPQASLHGDPEIDVAESTVSRYVSELQSWGLVERDTRGRRNTVHLTPAGSMAADFLTEDYEYREPDADPDQTQLGVEFTGTCQSSTSGVYSASKDGEGGEVPRPPEEWIAQTGSPNDGDPYVRWLNGRGCELYPEELHQYLLGGRAGNGITLSDTAIDWFEDGRVTYLSHDDPTGTTQVVAQWGGPVCTLARIASTLLSNKAWAGILDDDRLGEHYEPLVDAFMDDLEDVLQDGYQMGWCGEDELEDRESYKDRLRIVRQEILKRLAKEQADDDYFDTDLFADLHGLVATATRLYDLAGIDVVTHVRVPDPDQLQRDPDRYRRFCQWFRHTVPKNALYGRHSWYRSCVEADAEKLKSRLPVAVDPSDPAADLTMDVVVQGPGVTDFEDGIRVAMQEANDDVRERIRMGQEDAPVLDVPIHDGSSYAGIRGAIEQLCGVKEYSTGRDLRRLVRAYQALLGTHDRGPSPFDVVYSLLSLRAYPNRTLDIGDVEYAISQLPADRILPDAPGSIGRLLRALLRADDPQTYSDLTGADGAVSERSYHRHIDTLVAMDVVERTEDGFTASVEPWWAEASDRDGTDADQTTDVERYGMSPRWYEILYEATTADPFIECEYPPPSINALLEAAPDLEPWSAYVLAYRGHYDEPESQDSDEGALKAQIRGESSKVADALKGRNPGSASKVATTETERVLIGAYPSGAGPEQTALAD